MIDSSVDKGAGQMAGKTRKTLWIIPPQNTHQVELSGAEGNVGRGLTELKEGSLSEHRLGPDLGCSWIGTCSIVSIGSCKNVNIMECLSLVMCGEISDCTTLHTCDRVKVP